LSLKVKELLDKMLQKDPNKRPDVHLLFKEPKVIEGMQYLSEVLDEETTNQVIEKNITV
jgi:serine/threonine protein kinase